MEGVFIGVCAEPQKPNIVKRNAVWCDIMMDLLKTNFFL